MGNYKDAAEAHLIASDKSVPVFVSYSQTHTGTRGTL